MERLRAGASLSETVGGEGGYVALYEDDCKALLAALEGKDTAMNPLDQAILAYRENPTDANKARVAALQAEHLRTFQTTQADEFIRRTT